MMKRFASLFIIASVALLAGPGAADTLQAARLLGTWRLIYKGNYGYTFQFYKNYRSVCIIHLNTSAVIFKGIYSIEDDHSIRINIYEMKNDCNSFSPSSRTGFTKTSSTYFVFRAAFPGGGKTPILQLSPVRMVIDGRSSDGYFEPEIRLAKSP